MGMAPHEAPPLRHHSVATARHTSKQRHGHVQHRVVPPDNPSTSSLAARRRAARHGHADPHGTARAARVAGRRHAHGGPNRKAMGDNANGHGGYGFCSLLAARPPSSARARVGAAPGRVRLEEGGALPRLDGLYFQGALLRHALKL